MPWDLSRLIEGDEQDDWIQIECLPGRIFHFRDAILRGPDFSTPEEQRDFVLRQVCHLLIERIDGSGLMDVCQSLAEFYEFYKPTELSNHSLPECRTQNAIVNSRIVNPAFVIEEE